MKRALRIAVPRTVTTGAITGARRIVTTADRIVIMDDAPGYHPSATITPAKARIEGATDYHKVTHAKPRTWQRGADLGHTVITDALGMMHLETRTYVHADGLRFADACSWPAVVDLWPFEGWQPDVDNSDVYVSIFAVAPNRTRRFSLKPFKMP